MICKKVKIKFFSKIKFNIKKDFYQTKFETKLQELILQWMRKCNNKECTIIKILNYF